jgi:hypothetical protein
MRNFLLLCNYKLGIEVCLSEFGNLKPQNPNTFKARKSLI